MHGVLLAALAGLTSGQAKLDNIDFGNGSLKGWDGNGFVLVGGADGQPAAVTSADDKVPAKKGMIRYQFTMPPGVSKIRFQAYGLTALGFEPDHRLDVVLADASNKLAPKFVRTATGWNQNTKLLSRWAGKPRDYAWDVGHLEGQRVQIVIIDQDERPGSYVYCTGFQLEQAENFQSDDFAQTMLDLQQKHKLAPMARYDSKRFTAYSNASEPFTVLRLRQCEIIYDLFVNHFQTKGFTLHNPGQRLMLAIFDGPEGVDAYLGQKLHSGITGMYHPVTNRLLLYDLSENRYLVAKKKQDLDAASKIGSAIDRIRKVDAVERKADVMAKDVNLSTTMHEAAHQLSFNCGLLNRNGDVAIWLAEGLACYCEATRDGEWQALGAPNAARIADLARAKGKYLPLKTLINEDWRGGQVLLGYAQSWALFRMLVQEQPQAMRSYLAKIRDRRAPDYRLDDFRESFGDLQAMELRHHAYLRKLEEKR